jgi:hypothetical protein
VKPLLITLGVVLILWVALNILAAVKDSDIDRPKIPVVVLLSAIPVYWLVSRPAWQKMVAPGHCAVCGYDLTGNVSGTCPECGGKVG